MQASRIQISADLSNGLIDLLQANAVEIDAVEVGPWFSPGQIQAYRQQLPDLPFYLHYSNRVSHPKRLKAGARKLQAYLDSTGTPWISVHYSLLPRGYAWIASRFGLYLPPPDPKVEEKRFIEAVNQLKISTGLPVLLENMASFPTYKYAHETAPENIANVLAATGCGFLLDLAHARVAASVLKLDVQEYLLSLPLSKVRQIHLSGPQIIKGSLCDTHKDLQDEDYGLFTWVLKRTRAEIVTLEYIQDRTSLLAQLDRIRDIIAQTQPFID